MKGQSTQPVKVRPKEVSVGLGSYPGDGEGDQAIEALGTETLSFVKIRAVARDACSPYYKRAPDVAIPSRL